MNQFRPFLRPAAAVAFATLCLGLTPFVASAQTPATPDTATLLASLPQAMQDQLVPALGEVTNAKASGDARYLANAEAIYQRKVNGIQATVDSALLNTAALLAKNPTNTSLQSQLTGFQHQLDTLLALPH
jgi:hypothetical protein